MKRSRAVQAFLIISAAAGCGQRHEAVRRCVDDTGAPTDDRNCNVPAPATGHHYSWVYFPAGSPGASAGTGAATGAETQRGVVGAEGAAHASEGAHGGEAAGHAGGAGE
jgi:hypothetical protein